MKKFRKPEPRGRGPESRDRRPDSRRPDSRRPDSRHRPQSGVPAGRSVVGIHAVQELLDVRPRAIEQLWIRDKYADHPELTAIFEQAKDQGIKVQTQPPGTLDKIISSHQGVIAFASEEPELHWPTLEKAERATLLALDEVEDPHNLGAILRTCWLLGGEAVFTPEHRAAHLSPSVSKVAQGAVEHIPIVRDGALPQQLEALKKQGFWVLGLSHKAKQSIFTLDIPEKVVWVLGSESSGLRKSVEGVCDDLVSIPQTAPNASYNVSVAAAVALSETYRQRQAKGRPPEPG